MLLHIMTDNLLTEDQAVFRTVQFLKRHIPMGDHSLVEQWANEHSGKFLIKLGEVTHECGVEELLSEAVELE